MRTALAFLTVLATVGSASASGPLAAHRAVYEIDLAEATERSGITGMTGRMVYDFGGSSCDGYTVSFRFVTRVETEDVTRVTDQQTTTYENVEENVFQFATRSFVDQQQDRDVKGMASEGSVELTRPEERSVDLPEAAFPTQHTLELLRAAERGETLFERRIFDGSDDADKALATTAIIGKSREGASGEGNVLSDEFDGLRYWPVTIAYYNDGGSEGEALPLYRIEMDLFENGVARDIAMDYGDFRLSGTLSQLDMKPSDDC